MSGKYNPAGRNSAQNGGDRNQAEDQPRVQSWNQNRSETKEKDIICVQPHRPQYYNKQTIYIISDYTTHYLHISELTHSMSDVMSYETLVINYNSTSNLLIEENYLREE